MLDILITEKAKMLLNSYKPYCRWEDETGLVKQYFVSYPSDNITTGSMWVCFNKNQQP